MATRNPESRSASHLEDFKTSNRDLTSDEKATLRRAASIFFRLSLAIFGLGALVSAFLIRFVESMIRHSFKPELSGWGWLLAILIGIVLGWGKFRLWLQIHQDIRAGETVTVRKKGTAGKDEVVKEYLPISRFHLINNEKPKDWHTR